MQGHRIWVMLGFALFLAVPARADRVTSDYDHKVDFSKYKTFMWIKEPEPPEPLMKDRIMAFINEKLTSRGVRQVEAGADLGVGANVATEERQTWETYYTGSGWDWAGGVVDNGNEDLPGQNPDSRPVRYQDPQSDLARRWSGRGPSEACKTNQGKNDKQIEKMFRNYPGFAR